MKILVFSDSHGNASRMSRAISMHPDAEMIFFLGDGLREAIPAAREHSEAAFLAVRGNCDRFVSFFSKCDTRTEEIVSILGHRILLTHGHAYGVKGGLGALIASAERQEADLVLFGHTHLRHEEYLAEREKPLRLFNPGSISLPWEGKPSYGIVTLRDDQVLLSHGEID